MSNPLRLSDPDVRRRFLIRASFAIPVILFLVVNFVVVGRGIMARPDSGRYVTGANMMLSGEPLAGKRPNYTGYIAVVAGTTATGAGIYGVVAIQLLAALLAIAAMYDLARSLGGHSAGIAAASLLAADSWLALHHFMILTDSLYAYMTVLTVWATVRATERGGWLNYLLCIPVLALAVTLRPDGWILLPIVAVYIIWRKVRDLRLRWLLTVCAIIAFVGGAALIPAFHTGIDKEDPVAMLRKGVTVYASSVWNISMPKDPLLKGGQWSNAVIYAFHYPIQTAGLMLTRVGIYLANLNPQAPLRVNIASSIWLAWVYPLAVFGFIRERKSPVMGLSLAIILAHVGIVALTFVTMVRFLLYILPLFYLFTAIGVTYPGVPGRSPGWKAVQVIGVGVITLRIVSGYWLSDYWTTGSSTAAFSGPSPAVASLQTAKIGQHIRLEGFTPMASPAAPGSSPQVVLYWRGDGPTAIDYFVSVQLLDEGGSRVTFRRAAMGYNFMGTSLWTPGLRMVDTVRVKIPDGAQGRLNVYLQVLGTDKTPLPITAAGGQPAGDNGLLLQSIEVSP